MNPSFKAAVVGPSRVGKTTLLTAILAETERLLAGSPVAITPDEKTANRVRANRRQLRGALEAGEFNAAALKGTQEKSEYTLMLQSAGDDTIDIPFSILDFPGGWLDPAIRESSSRAATDWARCEAHIRESVMLLVPIDSAVLMEAVTPQQRRAVPDLLAFEDVEAVARKWAMTRNMEEYRDEPAVLVLAPIKCEKYFGDNGGHGRDADRLKQKVREKYGTLLEIVAAEAQDRDVRVLYAPIDTYGCVELMEAHWPANPVLDHLDFEAHYRFRGNPPRISVKAAATIMQELCRCVMSGWDTVQKQEIEEFQGAYQQLLARKVEAKGFRRALTFYLGGEARRNRLARAANQAQIAAGERRRLQLQEAVEKLATTPYDRRVEEW